MPSSHFPTLLLLLLVLEVDVDVDGISCSAVDGEGKNDDGAMEDEVIAALGDANWWAALERAI